MGVNILIGAQIFCWPKFINQIGQNSAFGRFLSCVGKSFLWFRRFCTIFLLLATPYVMFESKKTQILIAFLVGTKKVQLVATKKVSYGLEDFAPFFCCWPPP